jgi:galactonate dehydratase
VGITGFMKIAKAFAGPVVPHLSIAMGPQVAAAIHVAAAAANCGLCEYNPNVLATANAFLTELVQCEGGRYAVPSAPGLGIEWNDRGDALTGDA